MKTLITTIALMASFQTFAQFNPHQKLEAGRDNFKKGLDANKRNLERIETIKNTLSESSTELSTKNPIEVTAGCSEDLLKNGKKVTDNLRRSNQNEVEHLNKEFVDLEINVKKYINAEQCSACDVEIRQETMKRYAEKINQNVEELGKIWEIDSLKVSTEVMETTLCKFDRYFSVKDSEKFTNLKRRNFGYYEIGLTALNILSNEYENTIDYITSNAPIEVQRDATRIGKAKSEFKNGAVKITLEYDFSIVTGYDNVFHPVGNPVSIIHSALK